MKNIALFKEYAELKIKASSIEEQLSELKPQILKEMAEEGVDKVPTSAGDFTITKRKNWTYSNFVDLTKKSLDELKSKEEADGTATFIEAPILVFKESKE